MLVITHQAIKIRAKGHARASKNGDLGLALIKIRMRLSTYKKVFELVIYFLNFIVPRFHPR